MPRSLKKILEQADELQAQFERHHPGSSEIKDATALRALRQAALKRVRAEAELADAVALARTEGHSCQSIGAMLGTSGEAARQRYSQPARAR
jgi:MoxR-like ATPase